LILYLLQSKEKHKFTASVTSSKTEEQGSAGAQSCLAQEIWALPQRLW